MADDQTHIPVLYEETLDLLRPKPNGQYIDGTVGAGGHAFGILAASAPDGRLLAFDRDAKAISFTHARLLEFENRITYVHASYSQMGILAPAKGFGQVDGILLDFGLSSRQLADKERGFSFQREGPLDMRFDSSSGQTAADLLNHESESDLADIFWRYGEIRRSRYFARLIVANRPFTSTTELADLISMNVSERGRTHPATQLFQAIRIAVNQELDLLQEGLEAAIGLLRPGGRFATISFHSLEDRLVKRFFRELAKDCVCPPQQPICTCETTPVVELVTRKAIKSSAQELVVNPRSRSARLRVVEKL